MFIFLRQKGKELDIEKYEHKSLKLEMIIKKPPSFYWSFFFQPFLKWHLDSILIWFVKFLGIFQSNYEMFNINCKGKSRKTMTTPALKSSSASTSSFNRRTINNNNNNGGGGSPVSQNRMVNGKKYYKVLPHLKIRFWLKDNYVVCCAWVWILACFKHETF